MAEIPDDWAPLADTAGMTIPELLAASDNAALTRSLQRLLNDLDDPNGVISAFTAFASG